MLLFLEECDACGVSEERVFKDSWSGKALCLECLGFILDYLTNSPASEEDNLKQLLIDNDLLDEDAWEDW